MAQIDLDQIRLIVENNMRNAGFTGDFENGWKDTIIAGSSQIPQPFNLKGLRDIISKSILDALTDAKATGTFSQGNITGIPTVLENTSQINITKNSLVPSLSAARLGDDVTITDPIFLAWIVTISAAVNSLASGSVPIVPVVVDGKITSGSSDVKIGG